MEVLLIVRSIGRRTRNDPLSSEGHAGLVLNLGPSGINDHWIVQGGPRDGYLEGWLQHATIGWYQHFSQARGAVWEAPQEVVSEPVTLVSRFDIPAIQHAQLSSICDELNRRRLRYQYETGPNSNTYVSMFMQRIGLPISDISAVGMILKGWNWR